MLTINDVDEFIFETAKVWCNGNEPNTRKLLKAWQMSEKALEASPTLTWYDIA